MGVVRKNRHRLFFNLKTRTLLGSFLNLYSITTSEFLLQSSGQYLPWKISHVLTCEFREPTELFLSWNMLLLC